MSKGAHRDIFLLPPDGGQHDTRARHTAKVKADGAETSERHSASDLLLEPERPRVGADSLGQMTRYSLRLEGLLNSCWRTLLALSSRLFPALRDQNDVTHDFHSLGQADGNFCSMFIGGIVECNMPGMAEWRPTR